MNFLLFGRHSVVNVELPMNCCIKYILVHDSPKQIKCLPLFELLFQRTDKQMALVLNRQDNTVGRTLAVLM